jgi:hypothetical protein
MMSSPQNKKNGMGLLNLSANQNGGILLNAILASLLLGALLGIANHRLINIFKIYTLDKNKQNSIRTLSTIQSVFADQRFCNSFFNNGHASVPGDRAFIKEQFYSDNPEHLTWIETRLNLLSHNLGGFSIRSIDIQNPVDIAGLPVGRQLKIFDAEIKLTGSLAEETPGLIRKTIGSLGGASNDLTEKLFLVLGQRGECYFRSGVSEDTATGLEMNAERNSCKALGGQITQGRCYLREYEVDNLGIPKTSTVVTNRSTVADAFCKMEANLLEKFTMPNAHSSQEREATWTSLCAKPIWTGCVDNKFGNSKILPNKAAQEYETQMDQGDVEAYIRAEAADTFKLRVARTTMSYNPGNYNISFEDESAPSFGDWAASGAILGPIGILITALLDCDQAKVKEIRTCKNGQIEIDRFEVKHEKPELFSCEWSDAALFHLPNDQAIFDKYGHATAPPVLTQVNTTQEIEASYTAYQNLVQKANRGE